MIEYSPTLKRDLEGKRERTGTPGVILNFDRLNARRGGGKETLCSRRLLQGGR